MESSRMKQIQESKTKSAMSRSKLLTEAFDIQRLTRDLKSMRATEWRLTRYRCDVTGAIPTKDFMNWKPDKIHFTASPQGHSGFTTEPPPTKNGQNSVVAALPRSRQPIFPKHDGFTTGPLLDSTIGTGDRESVASGDHDASRHTFPDNQINLTRALARALNS
jgi:hypothetical protein